jgi:hypothetical protein
MEVATHSRNRNLSGVTFCARPRPFTAVRIKHYWKFCSAMRFYDHKEVDESGLQ